jgi:hypothetical protein
MTSHLIEQLENHGEVLLEAYEHLIEAKKELQAASEAVDAETQNVKEREAHWVSEHAAGQVDLGSNETTRKARLRELTQNELDALELARVTQRRAQLAADIAYLRVEAADRELRVLEAIAKVTPAGLESRAEAAALTAAILERTPAPEVHPLNLDPPPPAIGTLIWAYGKEATVIGYPEPGYVGYQHRDGSAGRIQVRNIKLVGLKNEQPSPPSELDEDLEDQPDANGHVQIERPAAAVARPEDMPYELALMKGRLKLAAMPTGAGDLSVGLTFIGPRGGEKSLGSLLGLRAGDWQATTVHNRKTESVTLPGWGEALDWVLAIHDHQASGEPPAEQTKAPSRSTGAIREANDRAFAGHYDAGDGKLIFGDGWQRADSCLSLLTGFLRVPEDSAKDLIEGVTGKVYKPDDMVDAEALARELAGYHRDAATFRGAGEAKARTELAEGVEEAAGDDPDRPITEAEQEYAKAMATRCGLDYARLRQLVKDECDAPDLVMLKLADYRHLIWRVLPAIGNRAKGHEPDAKDEAVLQRVDEVPEDLAPQLEDDFAGV